MFLHNQATLLRIVITIILDDQSPSMPLLKHAYSKFHHQKLKDKNSDSFHISAQNINCRYSLELPYQESTVSKFFSQFITKTCLYIFDPLKPYFYTVKLGFTGVYIIFLIFAQKHKLWVLIRTASMRRF